MISVIRKNMSASTRGRGVMLTGTSTTEGQIIHTSVSSTSVFNEVWIWAVNNHVAPVDVTIEYAYTAPITLSDSIRCSIPSCSGLSQIIPGLIANSGRNIRAYASIPNVVNIFGYINTISG